MMGRAKVSSGLSMGPWVKSRNDGYLLLCSHLFAGCAAGTSAVLESPSAGTIGETPEQAQEQPPARQAHHGVQGTHHRGELELATDEHHRRSRRHRAPKPPRSPLAETACETEQGRDRG